MFYTHPVSFLVKLHLGADSDFLFNILKVGVGLNSGYPTLGLSFDLPLLIAFHITGNLTFYGQELGTYPGQNGYEGYNFALGTYLDF